MDPWERQTFDTAESWPVFVSYRDQRPPRRLMRPGPIGTAQLSTWAREHQWEERCAAYDRHVDSIVRGEREATLAQDVREIRADYLASLRDMRVLLDREIKKHLDVSAAADLPTIKPNELAKLLDIAIKADRLLRGEATEHIHQEMDLSDLSVEELRVFHKALTRKNEKR